MLYQVSYEATNSEQGQFMEFISAKGELKWHVKKSSSYSTVLKNITGDIFFLSVQVHFAFFTCNCYNS